MLKQRYIELEKSVLKDAVFSPYELTPAGISELRKNIIVSILSLATICFLLLYFIRGGTPYDWGYKIGQGIAVGSWWPLVYSIAFFVVLFGASRLLARSFNGLTETGLFLRTSVSDELQDEWELAQKHKSFTAAYEYLSWAVVTMFLGGLVVCGVYYFIIGTLPAPPRFGTVVCLFIVGIWVLSVLPISYLAWTLEPIEADGIDGPITKPVKPAPPVLTTKQKWKKRFSDALPFAFGGIVGVLWAINN